MNISAKFGPNQFSGFKEEEESMKSLQTRKTTTMDAKWWQKLTWPFGSGELKIKSISQSIAKKKWWQLFYFRITDMGNTICPGHLVKKSLCDIKMNLSKKLICIVNMLYLSSLILMLLWIIYYIQSHNISPLRNIYSIKLNFLRKLLHTLDQNYGMNFRFWSGKLLLIMHLKQKLKVSF